MATLAQARDLDRKGTAQLRVLARGLLILTAIPSALAVAGCSAALVQRDEVAAYASVTASPAHQRAEPHSHRFRAVPALPSPPDPAYKAADAEPLDTDLLARLYSRYQRPCYQH